MDKDTSLAIKKIYYNVTKMACFSPEKVQIILGGRLYIERKVTSSSFDKSYSEFFSVAFNINSRYNKMSEFYTPKRSESKVIQFFNKGKMAIFGGFYDGRILIRSTNQEQKDAKYFPPFLDKSPVIAVAVDQDDEFAFVGNEMGNIRIIKLNSDFKEIKLDALITDHLSAISCINCNSELNLWVSASVDGYINLYTLPLSKLLRSLKVDTSYCNYVFLSSCPLPSIVAIGEEKNITEIFVYSINGKLYSRQKEEGIINCPIILKNMNSEEFLAYIINDSIIIRAIPTLIRQTSIENIPGAFSICPSEDLKLLYVLDKNCQTLRIVKDGI